MAQTKLTPRNLSDKQTLELIIDSIEDIREYSQKTNEALRVLELNIKETLHNCSMGSTQTLNNVKSETVAKTTELEMRILNLLGSMKEQMHKDMADIKETLIGRIVDVEKSVSLINQKVGLIVAGVSFGIGIIFTIIQFIIK